MLHDLQTLWALADDRRRPQLIAVLGLSVLGATAEVLSVSAVLPLLALAAGAMESSGLARVIAPVVTLSDLVGISPVVVAAAALIIVVILSAILRLLLLWKTQVFVYGLEYDVMVKLYQRIIGQRYDHFVQTNSSQALAGLEKVHVVGATILSPLLLAISAAVIATCIVSALFYLSPFTTTVAALFMTGIYVLLSTVVRKRMHVISKGEAEDRTQRVKLVQETLGGMRDIVLDQSERHFFARLHELQSHARDLRIRSNFLQGAPRFVVEAAGVVLLANLAIYFDRQPGGMLAALPILGALALGAQRLIPLLQQVYLGWASAAVHHQHLRDILVLLDAPQRAINLVADRDEVLAFREITLNDVTFRYSARGGEPALDRINLRITAGDRIGIIGRTGSGKSTLVDVLMGLLHPSSGVMMVDGVQIAEHNVRAWQAQIAHVPQSIFLFDASIAANIVFGDEPLVDPDRLKQVVAQAGLSAFLASLPDGLETCVGERGIGLSGGQRQRIGIARALYKDAPLLVLDEATSALDHDTEAAIMASIESIGRERTIIMIAHRTKALRSCDRIIRLSSGRVVSEAPRVH